MEGQGGEEAGRGAVPHTAVVFGPQAKPAAKYLKKGQLVLIEGRLEHRSWEGNDGTTKHSTEIIAERVEFGPKVAAGQSSSSRSESDVHPVHAS